MYADEDTEQMSRLDIMVALNTHELRQDLAVTQGIGAQRILHVIAEDNDVEPYDYRGHGVFGRGTNFTWPNVLSFG